MHIGDAAAQAQAAAARKFHTLDALRGVAALAVVTMHYETLFEPFTARNGGLAVDLFFLMSGAVLANAYDRRLAGGMGVTTFMRIRAIRLYPLYLLSLLPACAVAVLSMVGNGTLGYTPTLFISVLALALFMLPGPSATGKDGMFPLNPPTWSLLFEVVVNFLFVAFWKNLRTANLVMVCAACVPVIGLAVYHYGDINRGSEFSEIWVGLIRTLFGFSLGVVFARMARPAPTQSLLLYFGILAGTLVLLCAPWSQAMRPVAQFLTVVALLPVLVLCAMCVEPPPKFVPASTVLGLTSYAIYVMHVPTLQMVLAVANKGHRFDMVVLAPYAGFVALALLLALGWALDKYYDVPVRQWLSKKFGRSKSYGAVRSSTP